MSASEATETHKETRAFREDAAGCLEPPSLRHRLVRETISRTRGGGGGLWRSLECPSAAGPPSCQRPVQLRPWCPRLAPRSGLHIVQWHPGPGSRQGPGLAGRAGASLTGAASFLRRPPGSAPAPLWVQPRASRGPRHPLSRHRCQCALGVGREITVRTPESMQVCFVFQEKKKKSFSCFSSFCCFFVLFFFEFFFFFQL